MTSDLKVITFLSGRGSNFNSLLKASNNPKTLGKFSIIGVFSDKPGAPGLYYAKEAGIPVYSFFRADYPTLEEFKRAIFSKADESGADLVTLAGYMQLVPGWFIDKWPGKIINSHPSLLPLYPGLNTHERAIADKVTEHGTTIHFVDPGVDTGQIIAQVKITVSPSDTPETLAARVLDEEHRLYPWVVSSIARGLITLTDGKVGILDEARKEAAMQSFLLPS